MLLILTMMVYLTILMQMTIMMVFLPLELLNGVPYDSDQDGIFNHLDDDDDNDGILTLDEINPEASDIDSIFIDSDQDAIPNHLDDDDDGDGILSIQELIDTDGDGILDALESTLIDTDNDGVSDQLDSENLDIFNDTDGDGFSNIDETNAGTDPLDSNDFNTDFSILNFEIASFLSPNGDGINDYWFDPTFERYPINQVWVYSRTGKLIFNTTNYSNSWNGSKNGQSLPEGSYFYQIDYNNDGSIDYSGWLYLTR